MSENEKENKLREEILSRYNTEEREQLYNAILEYDYEQNEGILWHDKEHLEEICFGKKVDNRLLKGLAEYILGVDKIYPLNDLVYNTDNIKVANEIMKN